MRLWFRAPGGGSSAGVLGVVAAVTVGTMLVGASLAGCSTAAEPGDPTTSSPAASSSDEPALDPASLALTAETYRSRFDAASGGMQLSVTNGDDAPALERVTATLTVHAETDDEAAVAATASVTIEAVDRLGQFAEWWRASCFAEAVAERAALAIRVVGDGAAGTARPDTVTLELVATPRSAGDSANDARQTLRLTAIAGTILLGMRDAAGAPVTARPLELVLDAAGTEPAAVRLETVPARCDPHAIAEDKQGTLFRVDATLTSPDGGARDSTSGTVTVTADEQTREAIYDAITRVCAARVGAE